MRRFFIPSLVVLVIVGVMITFLTTFKSELTPQLILVLFVPPLMCEAAFHLNLMELCRNIPVIQFLAIPGVI